MCNEHFIFTRQCQVSTVPKSNSVSREYSFQNPVQWLGGRFSNTTPSAIPGRCLPAMKTPIKILVLYFFTITVAGCQTKPKFDISILNKAGQIIADIDSTTIQTFSRWNYLGLIKGEEWWSKQSGDTSKYILEYHAWKDSSELEFRYSDQFKKDFPCQFYFDTTRYKDFGFAVSKGYIYQIGYFDSSRIPHYQYTPLKVQEIFPLANPFDTIAYLSKLKQRFQASSIEYTNEYSPMLDFYLGQGYRLTYLLKAGSLRESLSPDNPHDSINLTPNWTFYHEIQNNE